MRKDPTTFLRHVFRPATGEFAALVRDCVLDELRQKFDRLRSLTDSQLRNLVGSADRLLGAVVSDPAFRARCRAGGLDFAAVLKPGTKLIIEGGNAPEDPKRTIL